ncbi:MAG: hemerythrin domain-containing protein [Gammaproteobacteria bacterium]|nr:hemerythrin domain-containing protein [Gammaproteobacteria bacterium]
MSSILDWNPDLVLDNPVMDATHVEFVALLNAVGAAPPDALYEALATFVEHTAQHFAEEERWMRESRFPPLGCHQNQHRMVLDVAREVLARVAQGETHLGEPLATAIAEWFGEHVAMMDAVLKQYMEMQGYQPVMGDDEALGEACGAEACASRH